MKIRTLLCAACLFCWGITPSPASAAEALPDSSYVGSATCASCHQDAAEAWERSHHARAWTEASPENVLADFDDTVFRHDGVQYRFTQDAGTYAVTITEADGSVTEHRVHSVAGLTPLQQYIIETEPGRMQSFDVVWDVENARWYHLYPDQHLPPDDGLHWTGPYKNWNARCAECHATGFQKHYDPGRGTYASTQAEIGVGCEACHGQGSGHLDWVRAGATLPAPDGYGFSMDFALAETGVTLGQCAQCHSLREPFEDGNPLPGTAYHDVYSLALLRPGTYHADGQILAEVYVYGSFLQSKMYQQGVGCLDCHDAHSGELYADGNAVCTQCHAPDGNDRFPSLALKVYDDPAHHFHPEGSAGAQCRNCHMIERPYMGIDWRRDHSFRVPRPDLSAVTESPDACTDCHTDQSPAWAAAEIAKRHPDAAARPSFGPTLAAGRADPAGTAADLAALAMDAEQAGLVRATALWLLSQGAGPDAADQVAPLLEDDDALVRAAAIGAQNAALPQIRVQRLLDRLGDPARMVRIEAAKAMLNAPIARLPSRFEFLMQRAMGEWRDSLQARIDFPETHMILGGMALTMRNIPAALQAFRETVTMDPQREEAWIMLARITAAVDGPGATLDILQEAREALPDSTALRDLSEAVRAE